MKKVIMGIGIPGSGKTTVLKEFACKNGYVYICPDDIRNNLTGNTEDQSKNRDVWGEAYMKVKKSLAERDSVVFDATFTNQKQRKDFISFARQSGSEKIQGIYLDVDLEVAKKRNSLRERKVPESVLGRMNAGLKKFPPEIEDGFDLLVNLNEEQKLIDAELVYENNIIHKSFEKLI